MSYVVSPVHGPAHHVGHGFADVVLHAHASDLLLDGAVRVDLGAELGPVGGVVHRLFDDGAHGAGERGAHAEATVVEDLHGHLESVADAPQHILGGHGGVVKHDLRRVGGLDAHLLFWRAVGHATELALDNEGRDLRD